MSESEIRARLERALHQRITSAEWRQLQLRGLIVEYRKNWAGLPEEENWRELRNSAKRELELLRSFTEDKKREESGESGSGAEIDAATEANEIGALPGLYSKLSGRTGARSNALEALDRLRAPDLTWQRARIRTTAKPRGGVDGTVPQWVIFMGIEAWMPAEEVKEAYRDRQRALLAEQYPPKTSERAFQVADFVWQQQRIYGERPSWPVLLERWNEQFGNQSFESWRALRSNFVRGAKATPPRYLASEDEITAEVRSRDHAHVFEMWASSFRD